MVKGCLDPRRVEERTVIRIDAENVLPPRGRPLSQGFSGDGGMRGKHGWRVHQYRQRIVEKTCGEHIRLLVAVNVNGQKLAVALAGGEVDCGVKGSGALVCEQTHVVSAVVGR